MKDYIEMMQIAGFPQEAQVHLQGVYEQFAADPVLKALLEQAQQKCMQADLCEDLRAEMAQKSGVHPYTVDLMLLLCCARFLRELYRAKGISMEMFAETMADLRYKLEECRTVAGVWGNFVFHWYAGFFDLTRFKLGRLQYEPHVMKNDYRDILKEGDVIYRCHIPKAGPLTPELVEESLHMAWEFYKPQGPLYVHCASWMLYPGHYDLYPEGSNLRKFYDRFDVYLGRKTPDNKNAWRIFGTMETDPHKLPADTALQRNFRQYFLDGNCMGMGYGVLTYLPK